MSKKENQAFGLIIGTILAISLFGPIVWFCVKGPENREGDADPFLAQNGSGTAEAAFADYADHLRQMADVKELCGLVGAPELWLACTSLPRHLRSIDNVEELRQQDKNLLEWLDMVRPLFEEACRAEPKCVERAEQHLTVEVP
ncbi:MAG: hypothetical protein WC730_02475 [Patescibacteria group bacterium]